MFFVSSSVRKHDDTTQKGRKAGLGFIFRRECRRLMHHDGVLNANLTVFLETVLKNQFPAPQSFENRFELQKSKTS